VRVRIAHVKDPPRDPHVVKGGHWNDERRVFFSLWGSALEPVAITELTGIHPDRSYRAGEPSPTGRPRKDGQWAIGSGLAVTDEFHDHVDALLTRIRPAWDTFVELGHRYEAFVEAAIVCSEPQGPLLAVRPAVSAALSELNATLGFDIWSSAGEETPTT
jgi:hypothetical protein